MNGPCNGPWRTQESDLNKGGWGRGDGDEGVVGWGERKGRGKGRQRGGSKDGY